MKLNQPDTTELEATVQRMEARLQAVQTPAVVEAMARYWELCPRFQAELASSRDVALAKSAALMLVQAIANAENAA